MFQHPKHPASSGLVTRVHDDVLEKAVPLKRLVLLKAEHNVVAKTTQLKPMNAGINSV